MKKMKVLLFTLLLMLVMEVKGTSLSVDLSCPTSAKPGTTISCTIKGNISGGNLNGISLKYTLSGVTYNSFAINSEWSQYAASSNGFSIGNTSGKTGSTTFGTVKLNVPSNATLGSTLSVTLRDIDCSDTTGGSFYASNKTKTIKILNTNNNLSALTVDGTSVPSFSKTTTSYTLPNTDKTSIVIAATKEDNSATISSGTGTKTLKYGLNTFQVVCKAENGTSKTYTIKITRNDLRSKDNTLKSLSINVGKINFSKNTTSYSLIADHSVNSVKITATANDSKATVSGTGTKTLKDYANKFSIVVKAENGSTKTYTITVNRKDDSGNLGKLSNDNYLKSLTIKDNNIKFDKNTLTYNIEVGTDISNLDINAVANNSNASVTINGNENFKLGLNKVEIVVKAENGENRTYVLNVTQARITIKMSMDELKSLKEMKSDISVNLIDDYILPTATLDLIKASKKMVVLNKYDNDNLVYSITINGEKIENTKDTNLEITFRNDVLAKKLNYPDATYINIKDDLPKGSILKVMTNKEYEKLSLYNYQKEPKIITSEVANNNNYADIEINTAGDYILTIANFNNNDSGTNIYLIIAIIEGILLIGLIALKFIPHKRKKKA